MPLNWYQKALGGTGGKVDWVIDELLAKGATMLLVAQARSGKTSLLYAAAAAVEEGSAFLEQIQTKQGRVLIIQGDEPENDCYNKLKIMDLEGAFDIVFPHPAGALIGLKNSLGTTI